MNNTEYKSKMLQLIKADKYISDFINSNRITDKQIEESFSVLLNSYESHNICNGCKCLDECKQKKKGQFISLTNNQILMNDVTYCNYYLNYKNEINHHSSFVYNDIPEYLNNVTMDNIKLEEEGTKGLFMLCHDILEGNSSKGLYIYGDLGVGKSYMCIALANSLVNLKKSVAFFKCNDFINKMREMIINDNQKHKNIINKIKKCSYLFIDDIGSDTVSSYSRDDLLFNILDYRMEHKLCTIFTSNLSKDDLLKHYQFDKNDKSGLMMAKRLVERIDILTLNFVLEGKNKRR